MGKYDALGRYLSRLNRTREILSFNEVEEILGFPLPMSSRTHRPWWSNDKTHVQAVDGWLSVGWKVQSAGVIKEIVTFRKLGRSELKETAPTFLQSMRYQETMIEKFTPRAFEDFARFRMSAFFEKELRPRRKRFWPKLFDMVSNDYGVVGDAKYMSMVRGKRLPPAKFSVIAEHVWILEKINAAKKFLVFGNDRRVPEEWLKRYGRFVNGIEFYFITEHGNIVELG